MMLLVMLVEVMTILAKPMKLQINSMVLLVQIKHVDGRLVGPDVLTESTFRELCQ